LTFYLTYFIVFLSNKKQKEIEQMKNIYEQLIAAKSAEEKATKKRIELEEQIFDSVRNQIIKSEGQETLEIDNYKLTVNQPMNYKLDEEKYRALAESLPEECQFHRVKLEIDKRKFQEVKNSKFGKKCSDCVTCIPGKVSIKIERI